MTFDKIIIWFLCALIVLFAVGLFWRPAKAHDAPSGIWQYPIQCCSGFDCDHIHEDQVRAVEGGYRVHVPVGSHMSVRVEDIDEVIPYNKVKPSPDGEYHICIQRQSQSSVPGSDIVGGKILCFFAPPQSF